MRFPFIVRIPGHGAAGLAPMLPLRLGSGPVLDVDGLLDTGAALSVLPWSVGAALGLDWDVVPQAIGLWGNLSAVPAKLVALPCRVASYPPVRLGFAWAKTDAVPVLLGRMNFFQEFDVCFYQSAGAFEVRPRGTP